MNSCIHNKFKKEIQILGPDNAFFYSMQDNSQHEHISLFFIQLFLVQDCKDIFCLFLQPWLENMLHVGILQPPLDRDNFPWQHRSEDLELYRRPATTFGREPITIHLAGQKLKQEKLQALRNDYETWKSKIVIKDPRGHFHRSLPATEMDDKGQNQIDKLKGLLKDKPDKLSLKRPGFNLKDIPPLNVVLNPSVDTLSRLEGKPCLPAVIGEGNEKTKGFNPGPFEECSWAVEKNKIPVADYEHQKFIFKKGYDFK